jgi:hypothetical protein
MMLVFFSKKRIKKQKRKHFDGLNAVLLWGVLAVQTNAEVIMR